MFAMAVCLALKVPPARAMRAVKGSISLPKNRSGVRADSSWLNTSRSPGERP